MKIQVINKSKHKLPQYATAQSAGLDIRANIERPITLRPLQRMVITTGLHIALPEGYGVKMNYNKNKNKNNCFIYTH